MSSRQQIYRNYLGFLSPQRARRVLWMLGIGLIVAEGFARLADPQYQRTSGNSLQGVRAIYQRAMDDPAPKILALGDSSLVGGGIYDQKQTILGQMQREIIGPRIYNMALPGGDTTSTTLLLGAIQKNRIPQVDRVIIEVLPARFMVNGPDETPYKFRSEYAWKELNRLIPSADPAAYDLPVPQRSLSQRVETEAQWQLGRYSRFYRHRDYLRTQEVGNYPIFWLAGKVLPRAVLARLYPNKAKGTNRLSARVNDFDFVPDKSGRKIDKKFYFTSRIQGDYLLKSVELAKKISAKPPIILAQPWHYDRDPLTPQSRASAQRAIKDLDSYLRRLARQQGCELVIVPSADFRDSSNWTVTFAHLNARGARRVWEVLRPKICGLYECRKS